jgi:hypothetical protein
MVVVVVAIVVVVVGAMEGGVSVVVGSPATVVVDIGANVEVVDASSPEADWHPAARKISAAANRRGRRICIGLRCYVGWRVKRFNPGNRPNYRILVLAFIWGLRGLQQWSIEVVGICGLDTTEYSTSPRAG